MNDPNASRGLGIAGTRKPPLACVFRLLLRLVIVLGAVLAGLGAVMIGPGAWGTFCFRTRY
jgi:hypothetical protein